MQLQHTSYKGHVIEKRIDVTNNSAVIYKDGNMVKCIAGNISKDGSENSIEKAKNWIDQTVKK